VLNGTSGSQWSKDLVAKITKKDGELSALREMRMVVGAIADLAISHNAAQGLTTSAQVTAIRLGASHVIDEVSVNIIAGSERARQAIFTMHPALYDLREHPWKTIKGGVLLNKVA